MKRTILPLGIATFWLACSQAPPPQVASRPPTSQEPEQEAETPREEARQPSADLPTEQDDEIVEPPQRETEERILTLTALVTELQVDMYGKKALYDALKGDPNSPKKALREARKNYREAAEQLRTLKERLVEEMAEQKELDRLEAERRQRNAP